MPERQFDPGLVADGRTGEGEKEPLEEGVGRIVTTGKPDHARACSLRKCWLKARGRVPYAHFGGRHLRHIDQGLHSSSRATVAMVTLASRYPVETGMPK